MGGHQHRQIQRLIRLLLAKLRFLAILGILLFAESYFFKIINSIQVDVFEDVVVPFGNHSLPDHVRCLVVDWGIISNHESFALLMGSLRVCLACILVFLFTIPTAILAALNLRLISRIRFFFIRITSSSIRVRINILVHVGIVPMSAFFSLFLEQLLSGLQTLSIEPQLQQFSCSIFLGQLAFVLPLANFVGPPFSNYLLVLRCKLEIFHVDICSVELLNFSMVHMKPIFVFLVVNLVSNLNLLMTNFVNNSFDPSSGQWL
mmetsp:Transcript_8362/g.20536  ORF Transcript_8362/g.20536 Transcript_8362/m.20536 type:complete len:261 (+) Transcript_8362:191-973(+)